MNRPSNDEAPDLLGYVLGALDADEQQQIQLAVDRDDALQHEIEKLKTEIARLDGLAPPGPPPVGLARRTCERIAAVPLAPPAPPRRRWFGATREPLARTHSWSLGDCITVAVAALVMAAVILPALNHSRFQSRLLTCQNNLRHVGMGLLAFAGDSNDRFVAIPESGNRAVAGCFAPVLCEMGYVDDPSWFLCAGLGVTPDRFPPSCDEIDLAVGPAVSEIQKRMSGDFAYTLGYQEDGRYMVTRNLRRSNYVLLADAPSVDMPGRASLNHGGHGQNCFFEDGHIAFVTTCAIAGDSIYENDFGGIAPGAHPGDIVVGPSHTRVLMKSE